MDRKNLPYVLFLLLILFVIGSVFVYLNINRQTSILTTADITPTPGSSITKTVPQGDLPIVKKDTITKKEIIEIPFNYVIKAINDNEMIFQKENGSEKEVISYYPKTQNIKVYKGAPPNETTATVTDLKVGQKIKVKNIIGDAIYFYIIE